jgi:hypothetical protein
MEPNPAHLSLFDGSLTELFRSRFAPAAAPFTPLCSCLGNVQFEGVSDCSRVSAAPGGLVGHMSFCCSGSAGLQIRV